MNMKLSQRAATLIGAAIAYLPSAVHAQCDESFAQLKVTYKIEADGWADIRLVEEEEIIEPPFLAVRPSSNSGYVLPESKVTYNSLNDVVDFDMCVPRDGACIELVVAMFPTDSYRIYWDGEGVEKGDEFTYWNKYSITSTELGGDSCVPVCDNTEALFEYNYWTGGTGIETYRLEDGRGESILGCDVDCEVGLYYSLFKERICLPRDSCYQFVAGSAYQWIAGYHANAPLFSISFDEEVVGKSESWLFKSINFGDSCPCDHDKESVVELFLTRETMCGGFEERDFSWDLSVVDSDSSSIVSSGIIPDCANTTLFQERMCVPKRSCVSFFIESTASIEKNSPHYSLTMDGVTYRSGMWDELTQGTNMGRCTVEDLKGLCDQPDQALFEVEVRTSPEFSKNGTASTFPAINYYDISWLFDYSESNADKRTPGEAIHTSWDYISSSYDLGSVYRTIECVPKAECVFDFNMTAVITTPIEEYTVKRNGEELEKVLYGGMRMSPFGTNCARARGDEEEEEKSSGYSMNLSVAGIVGIACTVGFVVGLSVIGSYVSYRKQQKKDLAEGVDVEV